MITPEIRERLAALVAEAGTYVAASALAEERGLPISATNIWDAVHERAVSRQMENLLRELVGAEALPDVAVFIDPETQQVIAKPGHGRRRRPDRVIRQVTLTRQEAAALDAALAARECKTLTEYIRRFVLT